ncbi:hypothetical protein K438DRAFT_2142245, partial [Mycena galopus ATCC 62051]
MTHFQQTRMKTRKDERKKDTVSESPRNRRNAHSTREAQRGRSQSKVEQNRSRAPQGYNTYRDARSIVNITLPESNASQKRKKRDGNQCDPTAESTTGQGSIAISVGQERRNLHEEKDLGKKEFGSELAQRKLRDDATDAYPERGKSNEPHRAGTNNFSENTTTPLTPITPVIACYSTLNAQHKTTGASLYYAPSLGIESPEQNAGVKSSKNRVRLKANENKSNQRAGD